MPAAGGTAHRARAAAGPGRGAGGPQSGFRNLRSQQGQDFARAGHLQRNADAADTITTEELLAIVEDLNRRPEIDGILVQMPLPTQVDSKRVLLAVSPEKDVDGFHPVQRRQSGDRPARARGRARPPASSNC